MSLLSSLALKYLLPELESELIKNEPDIQLELLAETKEIAEKLLLWVDSKIESKEGK